MKKLKKDVLGFTTAGVTLGTDTLIMSGVASKSPSAAPVLSSFSTMGSMMPIVGTATMGMNTIRMTEKMYKKKKR